MRGFKMILSVFVLAIVLASGSAFANMNRDRGDYDRSNSNRDNFEQNSNAPAFSSPEVKMAPNGDRVGEYPPYYYPGR